MPVPTARLVVLAAVASLALLVLPGDRWVRLALVNGVLLAVAAADAWLAPAPGSLPVRRDLAGAVTLGGSVPLRWTVGNPTRRPLRLGVADAVVPSLGAETRRFEARVPAGAEATASTTLRPARRGRFDLDGLDLRVEGPLGLMARQGWVAMPTVLRVLPAFPSRVEAELRVARARELGIRTARGRGGGTEFDQLREYSPDDEFRRIDWAATARARRPIVRAYRAERNQPVVVLVDNGRTMAGQVAGVPRVEHAMDAALALTTLATRLGDRVGLVAFDQRVRAVVPASAGRTQVGRAADALYELTPALVESDYRAAFLLAATQFRRRSLLVVCTEPADASLDETLLPALPVLLRRHVVVVAAVRDPEVERWASAPVPDGPGATAVEAVHRRAAALSSLAERAQASARLRGRGALVVDAPPGRLAPLLLDTYLGLKATGRL